MIQYTRKRLVRVNYQIRPAGEESLEKLLTDYSRSPEVWKIHQFDFSKQDEF